MDNTKVYIYIIMDNLSRYILNWKVALELSAKIFVENLKETYQKILLPLSQGESIDLIVDGGSENNNNKVDEYLQEIDNMIRKLVAQKDIIFSNSIIESVNKTLKYRHLFQHDLPDYESVDKYLAKAIPEYNNRPHCAHNGMTPKEVLTGQVLDIETTKKGFQEAYKKRIQENRKVRCVNCEDTA